MDSPFPYNKVSIGYDFLCRKKECNLLMRNIQEGRHSLLYDAPRTGKHSLVRQAFKKLKEEGFRFIPIYLNLLDFRSFDVMLSHYAEAISEAAASNKLISAANEYADPAFLNTSDEAPLTASQTDRILSAPDIIAAKSGVSIVVWFDEFQNIRNFEDSDAALRTLELLLLEQQHVTYILMGSRVNSMKYLFEDIRLFFNFAVKIDLSPLQESVITDRIYRGFTKTGKVVEMQQVHRVFESVEGHPWYIWNIANICFNLTRGYLNSNVVDEALDALLSTHEIRFTEIIDSLSNYQLRLLRAVFDGETRLNSQDTIEKYRLNTSANVHRLKEALLKKEVITLNGNDVPQIIDPLFKLWLKTRYFTEQHRTGAGRA